MTSSAYWIFSSSPSVPSSPSWSSATAAVAMVLRGPPNRRPGAPAMVEGQAFAARDAENATVAVHLAQMQEHTSRWPVPMGGNRTACGLHPSTGLPKGRAPGPGATAAQNLPADASLPGLSRPRPPCDRE
eukprot:CAMPEP_0179087854 /NCGR_PEP_ID=MMETSP0796-20121207/39938_1 /TAXON_ID=73915 /ORGANISM="Pyrodinium bahamense, Strain pbaha01" /LENGTH=129 /DNA_ID=CAMNT_0020785365 /DNA_START=183 /DNA_END=573 /DNA_ORIENTATION=-